MLAWICALLSSRPVRSAAGDSPKIRGGTRGVLLIAGGSALAQVVGIIIAPLLTRLYEPHDFGVFGLFTAILMIVSAVASWRYELAIPLAEDEDSAANVALVALGAVFVTTLLTLAAMIIGTSLTDAAVPNAERWIFTWLLPLGVATVGTYQVFTYWTIRLQRYATIAQTKLTQAAVLAAVQLGAPLLHAGPVGLVLGDFLGRSAGTARLMRATFVRQAGVLRTASWSGLRETARRYWRFPTFSATAALLNVLSWHLPTILVLSLFGVKAGGWFALTQRVIALPTAVAGQAVSQVYFGRVAELVREKRPDAIQAVFNKVSKRLLLLGAGPVAILAILGPGIFALGFGASWRPAGEYAQLMAFMFMARMVSNPLSATLELLQFQSWHIASEALRLALVLIIFGAAAVLDLTDNVTIGVYSACMALSYTFSYFLSRRAVQRLGISLALPGARDYAERLSVTNDE